MNGSMISNSPPALRGADGLKSDRAEEDSNIMATNDSSIVSKRAAEIMYYPQPHFLRYFVKKKKTRAPSISRGYWLRMKAIESVIRQFLDIAPDKRKVVINLGAGYDALPFQMMSSDHQRCHNATFVDLDYPELIYRKCAMIKESRPILDLLHNTSFSNDSNDTVLLRSGHYIAAGCDLNAPDQLLKLVKDTFDAKDCLFLLVAEVSICYMETKQANNVIRVGASLGQAQFCLLEQFLPRGSNYPFAKTMLAHFRKVKGTLKSIEEYPSLLSQQTRFLNLGWSSVQAKSLWQLWSDRDFLSRDVKIGLSSREPFDEWEDLALFASHYLLLTASTENFPRRYSSRIVQPSDDQTDAATGLKQPLSRSQAPDLDRLVIHGLQASRGPLVQSFENKSGFRPLQSRRFGAIFRSQESIFSIHGGYVDGTGEDAGRTNTTVSFSDRTDRKMTAKPPPRTIGPRMCHTITTLNADCDCILIGGRTSPSIPFADCWLRSQNKWEQVESLPLPLYRHSVTRVEAPECGHGVLLFGGRTLENQTSNRWFFWQKGKGWSEIFRVNVSLKPRFAASIAAVPGSRNLGLLVGGIGEDGVVIPESFFWRLENTSDGLQITLDRINCDNTDFSHRFGAPLIESRDGFYLVGGIGRRGIPNDSHDIMWFPYRIEPGAKWMPMQVDQDFRNLGLLVGHHAFSDGSDIVIVGGGAVCFSFGAYINQSVLRLGRREDNNHKNWFLVSEEAVVTSRESHEESKGRITTADPAHGKLISFNVVPILTLGKRSEFDHLAQKPDVTPFLLNGLALGDCLDRWSTSYLLENVGPDREIIVHRATTDHMSFQSDKRNFKYVSCKFREFIQAIEYGAKEYFRALSHDERDTPANLHKDFPSIAKDFELPPELGLVREKQHSSVLRISGPVAMWLHYDVMSNVLCQIRGRKTLILFPPSDVRHLSLFPGSSSSDLDVFAPNAFEREPLNHTHPYKVSLLPGQLLFIPALWLHAAEPLDGLSIAVNVFFRNLEMGYAAGRDTYANRDLQAYEEGRKDVKKIIQRFQNLPRPLAQFYLQRLSQEIEQQAEE